MYNDVQRRATNKYNAKAYDQTLIRFRKDGDMTLEAVREAAERSGESLQGFILAAIREKMERLNG